MPIRMLKNKSALALGLLMLSASPAWAEKADRDKEMHVDADRVTLDDAKKVGLFQGRVVLVQGTMQIRAAQVTVHQDAEGEYTAEAVGSPISFRQKADNSPEFIEAWSEKMEYDGRRSILKLIGRAHLKKGGDEVRGDVIVYDAVQETYDVQGGATTKAGATPGRVSIVLQPVKKSTSASGAPAPKAAGAKP